MLEHIGQRLKESGFTKPIVIFLISLIGPAIVLSLPFILAWQPDYLASHLYLFGTLGQVLMDLPALIMLAHDKVDWLGRKKEYLPSVGMGIVGAALLAVVKLVISRHITFMGGVPAFTLSLTLAWPWNLIATALAVFAYGPGEALYLVYLISAFDATTDRHQRLISRGVIITALLWGLSHSLNAFFFGWAALGNSLFMVAIGFVIGLIFKRSRSALGPIMFWSLVNGTSA